MTKESEALATFLSACIDGEMNGDNMKKAMVEYVQPSVPAWHDAPTCAGLWVCRQAITDNVQAYEVTDQVALNRNLKLKGQWYGPIPEDK